MNKLTIDDLDLRGKRVFIRVDFNVPIKDGVVTDGTRIWESTPTIRLVIQKGGRIVLASHLGRPKGRPDPKYSLLPVPRSRQAAGQQVLGVGPDSRPGRESALLFHESPNYE